MGFTITPDRIYTFLIVIGFISMFAIPSILEHKKSKYPKNQK